MLKDLTRAQTRNWLQARIDDGFFLARQSVIDYGLQQGWGLVGNSPKSIRFENEGFPGNQKRFGVRINFDDHEALARTKEFARLKAIIENPYSSRRYFLNEPYSRPDAQLRFIYILIATHASESVAYIGQSSTISKRLKGHLKRKIRSASSGPVRTWAEARAAPIRFCIVDLVFGDMSKGDATRLATYKEGLWTHRARRAGVSLLGVEGWGQFPEQKDAIDDVELWEIAAKFAQPAGLMFDVQLDFQSVCLPSVDLDTARSRFVCSVRQDAYQQLTSLENKRDE